MFKPLKLVQHIPHPSLDSVFYLTLILLSYSLGHPGGTAVSLRETDKLDKSQRFWFNCLGVGLQAKVFKAPQVILTRA